MGLFIKLLLLALVLALAAPFVIKGPDDQPLMTLDDIQNTDGLTDWLQSVPEVGGALKDVAGGKGSTSAKGKTAVYSWKDEQGNVHYSNIAPTETASVETIEVNPDINVIKLDKPAEGKAMVAPSELVDEPPEPAGPSMIQVYTPEGVNKVMNDARELQKISEERLRESER